MHVTSGKPAGKKWLTSNRLNADASPEPCRHSKLLSYNLEEDEHHTDQVRADAISLKELRSLLYT